MVSGFVTSPYDQERIFSGLARLIRIALKSLIVRALSNRNDARFKSSPSPSDRGGAGVGAIAQEFDVEAQALQLAHEHVERLRKARLHGGLALDERLVDLGPAVDVVRLDREQLLEDVRRAVGLERP